MKMFPGNLSDTQKSGHRDALAAEWLRQLANRPALAARPLSDQWLRVEGL